MSFQGLPHLPFGWCLALIMWVHVHLGLDRHVCLTFDSKWQLSNTRNKIFTKFCLWFLLCQGNEIGISLSLSLLPLRQKCYFSTSTYNMPASWWLCPRQELHWALKKVIRIVHFCFAHYADGLIFFEKMSLVSLSSIFSWVAECSESRYDTYLSCNYLPSYYLSSCSSSTYF